MKNNSYRPYFAAPDSSSTRPASSSIAPTSIGAPAIAAQMATNVDISDSKLWPDFVTKAFIDIGQFPHIHRAPRLSIESDIIPPALTEIICSPDRSEKIITMRWITTKRSTSL
ncbi:hypothetical protein KIW84_052342 [Lathyrus oleraceus]|uniref:Uncharacterized protein n=1 Tax=Pisum sativum TaxID=3888 RepID=A0A9D5AF43_PEA|nr:hypothetical protein KIW84_052342 [Pisum sativum]